MFGKPSGICLGDDSSLFPGMILQHLLRIHGEQLWLENSKHRRLKMLRSKSADFITHFMSSLKCFAVPSSVMDPEHI